MRYVGAALIVASLLMEGAARLAGFGSTLVYERTAYGYRVAPSQAITRLGRATYYNDLGLRNDSAAALPPQNAIRILCIGDSITYGGTQTDQDKTFPYQLQRLLASSQTRVTVEVLNASAGGWATENEEGWLNAHGVLGANWVILQVATHDLFQNRSGPEIVGSHPSFPDRQPWFALQDVVVRYVLPLIGRRSHDPGVELRNRSAADVHRTLSSIERIDATVRSSRAKLAVLFVEQPKSVEPTDNLTLWAKQQLFIRLSELGVPVIRPAQAIEQAGGVHLFRDGLHPNEEGNRVLASSLFAFLNALLQSAAPHSN
jgi:lysophospholipase L1-like esterase